MRTDGTTMDAASRRSCSEPRTGREHVTRSSGQRCQRSSRGALPQVGDPPASSSPAPAARVWLHPEAKYGRSRSLGTRGAMNAAKMPTQTTKICIRRGSPRSDDHRKADRRGEQLERFEGARPERGRAPRAIARPLPRRWSPSPGQHLKIATCSRSPSARRNGHAEVIAHPVAARDPAVVKRRGHDAGAATPGARRQRCKAETMTSPVTRTGAKARASTTGSCLSFTPQTQPSWLIGRTGWQSRLRSLDLPVRKRQRRARVGG